MDDAPMRGDSSLPVIDLRPELPRDLTRRREYLQTIVQFSQARSRRAAAMAELAWMMQQFSVRH